MTIAHAPLVSAAGARRDTLAPAFLAALALHLALLAVALFLRPSRPPPAGDVTPITLIARGPVTDSRPAEASPRAQEAQVETPVPAAKAPLPPPAPPMPAPSKPAPAPPMPVEARPLPRPAPIPKPKPAPAKPAPATPSPSRAAPAKPAPARDDDFLTRLSQSVAAASKSQSRAANARRGPTRAETAPQPRVDAGAGVSQSDLQGLQQLLERLWNPNCAAPGADQLVIPVKFSVDADGRVTGRIIERGGESAAARRAIDAVHQAEPYAAAYRDNTFTVNFDAQKACAGKEG